MIGRLLTLAAAILAIGTSPLIAAAAQGGTNMSKLGPALEFCYAEAMQPGLSDGPQSELLVAEMTPDGFVRLEAIAAVQTSDLAGMIEALGGRRVSSYGRTVSAEFPPTKLAELADSEHLAFARPSFAATNVGLVTSQGDRSMRTDIVRALKGLDGTGLTIGVLSDSFSCDDPQSASPNLPPGQFTTTADDIASGDLPADINNLADFTFPDCGLDFIDEGRAMAQLIHDVVPGAKIAFHTAFGGEADFAEGIVELALAGSDVIVDDVIYFAEPMFQDGIIAQAADEVNRLGVPYYSSNGNRARDAFQAEYEAVDDGTGAIFHDFDPNPGVVDTKKTVTLNGELQTNLAFNWDSPNFSVSGPPGAQTDVDVIMFDERFNPPARVPDCFPGGVFQFPPFGLCQFQFTDGGIPIDGGNGGDAIELVSLVDFIGGSTVSLGFETQSGPAPSFVKYVLFAGGFTAAEYAVDAPSGFGHNNAAGAEGVGAAYFGYTEEFIGDPNTIDLRTLANEPPCIPACLNDFSSAGGTPIFFDTDGNRLPTPEVRLKPGITGPDGTNNTFFRVDTFRDDDDGDGVFESFEEGEFPNFFGTSASAPHAAAVAAMMLDAENSQILQVKKNGKIKYNLCKPKPNKPGRANGTDVTVAPSALPAQLANGALLGPCSRTEPAEVRHFMRSTAQDMSVRADLSTGETIQTFDEVGPDGFDFDSGFGFIDAEAAIEAFLDDDD